MKKLLALLLALVMILALAACGTGSEEPAGEPEGETTTVPEQTTTEETEETTLNDGKLEYTVKVVDEAGNPIAAVDKVQVCDETNICSIIFLSDGTGSMRLAEAVYHANLLSLPEGYEYTTEETVFSFDATNTCTITLKAVQ